MPSSFGGWRTELEKKTVWLQILHNGILQMNYNKHSLLMHRVKIKSPANFLWNEQNVFVGGFSTFQSVLLWRY